MTRRPVLVRGDDDEVIELDELGAVYLDKPCPGSVERFAELEAGDRKELERAHRLELVAHLRHILEASKRTRFDDGDGLAAGLETAVFELEHWPPAAGVE